MGVTLLLMRHGIADSPRPGRQDQARPLTGVGRDQARAQGAALAQRGLVPLLVLESPYLRARESAEALMEGLETRPHEETWEELTPGEDPVVAEARLRDRLERLPAGSVVLAVSHQPLASLLVHRLSGISVVVPEACVTILQLCGGRFRFDGQMLANMAG